MTSDYKHTKTNEEASGHGCYTFAEPNEPLFTLLGRDRHGAALVELWAYMREKEGEPAGNVADAREAAVEMRAYGQSLGKPMLNLDSLVTLAASLVHEREAERVERARLASVPNPVNEGDVVTAAGHTFSGHVGRVTKVFPDDAEPSSLRGMVNVVYGRDRVVTMARAAVRLATEAEAAGAGVRR